MTVNDTAKIHVPDSVEEEHAIVFDESFRIPLSLVGIFSYFLVGSQQRRSFATSTTFFVLTPDRLNPNDDTFAHNEEMMLNWQGNIVPKEERRLVLGELPGVDLSAVSTTEENVIGESLLPEDSSRPSEDQQVYRDIPRG